MNAGEAAIDPDRYKWLVLIIVMIGTLMAALDSSIVNVSVPAIMADFGASVDDIEWVITGYMLAFATFMPLTAWLRDRIGTKILYIGSLILFVAGSLLCGIAWNLPSLIVARVIQAFGGGAITPTGMAMISEVFPPKERGKAIGIWGVGVIVGPAIGPTLGGFLTKDFGWRSIFLVNLPIGVIGVLFALSILVPDRPKAHVKKPFDFWGFFFLSSFLISFLLGLSQGEREGWMSAFIVWCGIVSFFSFIGFMVVETQIEHPVMELALFKSSVFSICMAITVVRSVVLFGGTFLLPLFLQRVMGLDEIQSGLILLPGALLIGLIMPFAGRLSDQIGPRILSVAGLVCLGVFFYMYNDLDANTSVWGVIKPTLVRGVGLGLLMAPISASVMNAVPNHKAGMASSMMNLLQQVGGSLGIGVLATIFSHRVRFHMNVVGQVNPQGVHFRAAAHDLFFRAMSYGFGAGQSRVLAGGLVAKQVALQAQVYAFRDAFLIGAFAVLVPLAMSFFLPGAGGPRAKFDPSHLE